MLLQAASFEVVSDQMTGPLIYGFSEDAVAAAKVVAEFAKTNDKLVIRAGAYGGKALDVNGVEAIGKHPFEGSAAGAIVGLDAIPHLSHSTRAGGFGGTAWRRCSRSCAPQRQPRRNSLPVCSNQYC